MISRAGIGAASAPSRAPAPAPRGRGRVQPVPEPRQRCPGSARRATQRGNRPGLSSAHLIPWPASAPPALRPAAGAVPGHGSAPPSWELGDRHQAGSLSARAGHANRLSPRPRAPSVRGRKIRRATQLRWPGEQRQRSVRPEAQPPRASSAKTAAQANGSALESGLFCGSPCGARLQSRQASLRHCTSEPQRPFTSVFTQSAFIE